MSLPDKSNLHTQEFWDEIAKTFKLSEDRLKLLIRIVLNIYQDIQRHKDIMQKSKSSKSKKEITIYLKKISKRLSSVISILAESDTSTASTLSIIFSNWLGSMLTNRAFERISGDHIPWSEPSFHDLEDPDAELWTGPYEVLERHYRQERGNIATRSARKLLIGLCADIKTQIDRQLELRRLSRGGSPGRVYRNYIIQELAKSFKVISGQRPTATLRGPFAQLCEIVLDEVGERTDGLEQAILRILKRMNLP